MRLVYCLLISALLMPVLAAHAQDEAPPAPAYVRFVNLTNDLPTLDFYADDTPLAEGLDPLIFTDFMPLTAGEHQLSAPQAGNAAERSLIAPALLTFEAGTWSTVVASGSQALNTLSFSALNQQIDDLSPENARVYFFNAMQDEGAIFSLGTTRLTLDPNEVSQRDLPADSYESLAALASDQESNLLASPQLTLQPFTSYFVTLATSGDLPQALVSQTDLGVTVKIKHFVVDYALVSLTANGESLLPNVNYANPDAKVTLLNGVYDFSLRFADNPQSPRLFDAQDVELLPGSSYTVQLTGLAETDTVQVDAILEVRDAFAANLDLLRGENAYLTLVNAIPDDPILDVIYPDGTVLIDGLNFRDELAVLDLPTGVYDLLITLHEDPDTVLFRLTEANLYGGTVYYLTAIGRLNDLLGGDRPIFVESKCLLLTDCAEAPQ